MTIAFLASYVLFWLVAIMYCCGLFGMMKEKKLMRKLMAMNIMQTAIILFYLLLGYKPDAVTPILINGITNPVFYANPLPQALMLTAIVVNLSTTGVALTLLIIIARKYDTLEEDEVLRRMCE